MISDDERREVARRIRETGEELGSAALLWYYIAKALGVRTATDGKTACGVLADLIEPEPERTCRVEVERRKLSQTQTAVVKSCSGCGFEFGVEKENTLPFEVTLNVVVPPNYCPYCGARVVEEASDDADR